jgi:hypothetical protein
LGKVAEIQKHTVNLSAMPMYGEKFPKNSKWTFYLQSSIACVVLLLMNPLVVGYNGEFIDFENAAKSEVSGSNLLRKQRAVRGLSDEQRVVSLMYFMDAAAVGKGRRKYKPLMVTFGELRNHARQRDIGAALVGYVFPVCVSALSRRGRGVCACACRVRTCGCVCAYVYVWTSMCV